MFADDDDVQMTEAEFGELLTQAQELGIQYTGTDGDDLRGLVSMARKESGREHPVPCYGLSYDPTNLLAASTSTFSQYATEILALNAAQANSTADSLSSRQVLVDNLKAKTASISGVNLDEELSLMIVLENAYAASARVITTSQNMFEMLTNMLR